MKDVDTYKLENMYGAIRGEIVVSPSLVMESSSIDELLNEGLMDTLGQNSARLLIGLVTREIPQATDSKGIENKAEQILNHITTTVSNPMVQRTLMQYADLPATARATALYKILADQ